MELIEDYLEKVQKIHGVYVLQVDDEECTQEDKYKIWQTMNEALGGYHPLYVLSQGVNLGFIERYSLSIALMMVRDGKKVTRDTWVKEVYPVEQTYHTYSTPMARKRAAHLKLNSKGELVQVEKRNGKEVPFLITLADMDANDYVVVPE